LYHFTANFAAMAVCVLHFHRCGYSSICCIPDLWLSWWATMEQTKGEK